MKNYKKLSNQFVFIILILIMSSLKAQVYVQNNKVMSKELIVKFKNEVINVPIGEKFTSTVNILDSATDFKNYLNQLKETILLEKMIPEAKQSDTLWTNPFGEEKKLNDWSQVFIIKFENPKDINVEIEKIKKIKNVEYVEPPVQIKNQLEPDDNSYGTQWYLDKIEAESAWDISIGSSDIRIAIIEGNGVADHDDVDNKKATSSETGYSGDHGIQVAGVAGAETDNEIGIASIGWNTTIVAMNGSNATGIAADIRNSANPNLSYKADIINCSFKTIWINGNGTYYSYNFSSVEDAIEDAQSYGALVVAAAGNPPDDDDDLDTVPFTIWPAAYTDVIGVSATNDDDEFPDDYNYGSFVDVSAPSINIRTTGLNNSYPYADGTSIGSPLVCSLAGLVLSIDPSFTASDITSIITSTGVDLGAQNRDDYFGYGRISANGAVLKALDILAEDNYSLDSDATYHNGSRKIEIDASSYQYRHLVFASGGQIYYKRRPVWTSIWSSPIRLSDESGPNDYPSIAVQDNNKIIVTWQRKISSTSYEIWIAKSDNYGASWDQSYELTTESASSDPFPVVSADGNGTYFELVFGRSSGLRGYTSDDGELWYGTTFSGSNNSGDKNPSLAAEPLGKTGMVYETASKKIYYRNRISYLGADPSQYYWISPFNLTTIIPGSNYSHVNPSFASGSTGEHVVWHRIYGSGSSSYNHSLIYRYQDAFGWKNEYTSLYYQNQQNPVITETDDYVWVYFQLITDDDIYRQKYNGYSWTGPEYVADGRHPSISTGKTYALPVWTTNSSSPYEIKVASTTLTKSITKETDPRDYYRRSIAVLDSSGNFIEVVLNNVTIKKYDGSIVRIPLNMSSLGNEKISTNNCWDLQTSELTTVSEDAESLFVNYEIKTSGYDKLVKNPLEYQKLKVNINNQNMTKLISKLDINLSQDYKNISESRTSKQYINSLNGENIKVSLSIDDIEFNDNTFASLGHIYDYNNLELQKEPIEYAKLDSSNIIENDDNSVLMLSPNPFNSQIKIEFKLKVSQQVNLTIFNLNGQLVGTLVDGFLNNGNHSYIFNGDNLSSGIYFTELKTKTIRTVKRMLLVK